MEGRRRNEIPRGLPAVSCFNVGHQFLQKRSISFLSATSNSTTFLSPPNSFLENLKLEEEHSAHDRNARFLGTLSIDRLVNARPLFVGYHYHHHHRRRYDLYTIAIAIEKR